MRLSGEENLAAPSLLVVGHLEIKWGEEQLECKRATSFPGFRTVRWKSLGTRLAKEQTRSSSRIISYNWLKTQNEPNNKPTKQQSCYTWGTYPWKEAHDGCCICRRARQTTEIKSEEERRPAEGPNVETTVGCFSVLAISSSSWSKCLRMARLSLKVHQGDG